MGKNIDAMTKKQLRDHLVQGEIIVTTRGIIMNAVKEEIQYLYEEVGDDFHKNRYATTRQIEQLTEERIQEIASDVLDYITGP